MSSSAPRTLPDRKWHTLSGEDALFVLDTRMGGLSTDEARRRLEAYGDNALAFGGKAKLWPIILHQFTSPLIYVLLIVMVVTLAIQHWADSIVIGGVVLLNAIIGFTQEYRAENAMQALLRLVAAKAAVLRDGCRQEVDSRQLVPGDVVFLESGDLVPSDIRLLQVTHLEIDEALLTGESLPVSKSTEPLEAARPIPMGDQRNMGFMGTAVTAGRGLGVVVATGLQTQMGTIAGEMRQTIRAETPLQSRMAQFGRWISVAILGISAIAFAVGIAMGLPLVDMFLTAVALSVAAIPEGLPVAMTVALAVGVHRMAHRNAVIRRLVAVETLGSCTVIVTDKTGTLTENQMTVQTIWTGNERYSMTGTAGIPEGGIAGGHTGSSVPEGSPLYWTLVAGLLNNESSLRIVDHTFLAHGDPTEVSLLVAVAKAGLDREGLIQRYPRVDHVPFESFRKFSATVHHDGTRELTFVKGAPERLADMCATRLTLEGLRPMEPTGALHEAEQMAREGLRVLAFAMGETSEAVAATRNEEPKGLVFLGLQGMMDPPRREVIPAISACKQAGIRVIMATGDHSTTATAIAQMVGLGDGKAEVRSGPELEAMSREEFDRTVRSVSVYSRVSPAQKLQIVNALRQQGQVVAVTGDGVNDAPALKSAHIGAAMGRSGTDVAREASDMVLADDNFATIYAAVEEGRTAFSNIRKVTFFLISGGAGQIIAILGSLFSGMPLPLLPTQLLWMNMVTNGIQDVALAFEPGEPHLYRKPPRHPKEGILSKLLLERTALVACIMAIGGLAMFHLEINRGATLAYAQVTALTTLVMFQVFHVGNSRSEEVSIFHKSPVSNPLLFYGTLLSLAVHIGAMYFPGTQFLIHLEPLTFDTWSRIVPVGFSVVAVVELHKILRRPAGTQSGGG